MNGFFFPSLFFSPVLNIPSGFTWQEIGTYTRVWHLAGGKGEGGKSLIWMYKVNNSVGFLLKLNNLVGTW